MATVTKNIGSVPVWTGEWQSGKTYMKYNIVGKDGNAYISTIDDNTADPVASVSEAGAITIGAGWSLFAGNKDGALNDILLKTAQALTPDEQAQVKTNLGLDSAVYYESLGEVSDIETQTTQN